MRIHAAILVGLLLATGCATRGPYVRIARPMESQSVGLHLITEPRRGPANAPYTILCNVNLHFVNNSELPLGTHGKFVIFAEQDGVFYPLREVQPPGGWGSAPYSMCGNSVTLPRPPRPGKYRIFAVQYLSEDAADEKRQLWKRNIASNSIFIEFAEINESDQKAADSVTQGLVDAGQYRSEFKEGTRNDPTSGWRLSKTRGGFSQPQP